MKIDYARLCKQTDDTPLSEASFAETVMDDHGTICHDAAMLALATVMQGSWVCFPSNTCENDLVEAELDFIIDKLTQFRDDFHYCYLRAAHERDAQSLLEAGEYEKLAGVASLLDKLTKKVNPDTYELFKTCIIKED